MDQHLFSERRQVQVLVHRLATRTAEARWFARLAHQLGPLVLAQRQMAVGALRAVPAEGREAGDHVVARLDVVDHRTDRLHDAGRLVTEHGRAREGVVALHEVQIAVAEARRSRSDQHFSRAGLADLDLLDVETTRNRVEHCSLHEPSPTVASTMR
jgi:hypothetical protein